MPRSPSELGGALPEACLGANCGGVHLAGPLARLFDVRLWLRRVGGLPNCGEPPSDKSGHPVGDDHCASPRDWSARSGLGFRLVDRAAHWFREPELDDPVSGGGRRAATATLLNFGNACRVALQPESGDRPLVCIRGCPWAVVVRAHRLRLGWPPRSGRDTACCRAFLLLPPPHSYLQRKGSLSKGAPSIGGPNSLVVVPAFSRIKAHRLDRSGLGTRSWGREGWGAVEVAVLLGGCARLLRRPRGTHL